MRTKDGHYVGSSWIKHNNKTFRNNYCVAVNFLKLFIFLFTCIININTKKSYFRL